jgi:2-oxoisovalerate dehydrogenase E2 component (dihydrolipoyl transacylase)
MRRAIAEHMVRSRQTAPHAWSMIEVDMTRLARWRGQIKEEFRQREGVGLTLLPFVLKATIEAIKENPVVNATWAGDRILIHRRVHVGIAVALEDGLIVPVIRDADGRSIAGLARAAAELGERARAGRLTPNDVSGGTFTLNNTGALGLILSQPIINQPQAAILTMEAVVKRPVVLEEDAIAVRHMMNMALSFDHRVMDGATVGRFLNAVKRRLEAMGSDTMLY